MPQEKKLVDNKKSSQKMPTPVEDKLAKDKEVDKEDLTTDKKISTEKRVTGQPEKNYRTLKWIIIGLIGLALACFIFWVGMVVGGSKAKFSYRWAENYHNNFAGPQGGFLGDWQQKLPPRPEDFIEGHGVFGQIIEFKDNRFVMRGQKDMEEVVIVTTDTVIKDGAKTIKDGLRVGEYVVVIGSPNKAGQIEAKLIRLFRDQPQTPPLPPKRF